KTFKSSIGQEFTETDFDLCRIPQVLPLFAGSLDGRSQRIGLFVFRNQCIDLRSGYAVDQVYQIAHGVRVDRTSEPRFGVHLVAVSHGDIAHSVAETGELCALPVVPRCGGACPHINLLDDITVLPEPGDHLPVDTQLRHNVPEFPVSMSAL